MKMGKVRDAMKRQLDCSRALCLACADLGNACSDVGLRDVGFQNAQFQLDEDMRKQLDAAVAKAVESLENKMAPFVELDKMIMSRNKLKLDYDHYMRKVRHTAACGRIAFARILRTSVVIYEIEREVSYPHP